MQARYFDGGRIAVATEMIKFVRTGLGVAAMVWAAVLGSAHAADVTLDAQKDDRGRPVAMAQPPQRIVSLLPSLTETVCALGACDKLVGVDRYSNWPKTLQSTLPILGGGLDPNVEAIVALKPDVVLLSNSSRVVERLEALGLRTVALEPRTQADVHRVLHSIGMLLGLPPAQGAEREWQRLQAGVDAAAQSVPAAVQGARVYFEVSRGPYAAGPSSFIGELLARMHVDNVVPAEMGPFPRLNPEFILRARPDVILMGNYSMQLAHAYPGWASLEAVKHRRVCAFNAEESTTVVRPGPRMDEAARIIARCLAEKAPRRVN
ncbi:Vitamin B12-binding protein precursor [compost metagenome]|jgi:iron complex transport system substrate-binding protein